MLELAPLFFAAAAVGIAMLLLWLLSLRLRDSGIVDLFWGPAFALVAWIELWRAGDATPRQWLVAALVTVWGLRLGLHLARRNLGRGEDPRYAAMRARHGDRWPLRSLWLVFGLQGALVLLVALPIHAVMLLGEQGPLGWLDWLGVAVWLAGVGFEAVGDAQLARFKREPSNRGKVMTSGLWRYTRHPNYFGDALVWWGLYGFAAATGWGSLAFVGPLVMTFLLLKVSGVPLLEQAMAGRPGYADYAGRTSAFFPCPPRR